MMSVKTTADSSNTSNTENAFSKAIIVRRKLATGEVKVYRYNRLCGVPINEYQRDYHKVNYVPRTNRIPKHKKLPEEIKSKIVRLHSIGVGQEKIVKLLALEYPQKNIGIRTVSHLIHENDHEMDHSNSKIL